jgi:hypothetical protein
MAIQLTDEERQALSFENFDTTALLSVVDDIDEMRGFLNDREDGAPPELRSDVLRLHQLAMAVFNEGSVHQVPALFRAAAEVEDEIDMLMTALERIQSTLGELTALYPESLSYEDLDDEDASDGGW